MAKRYKMSKSQSRRNFSRNAGAARKNFRSTASVMRGGYRL